MTSTPPGRVLSRRSVAEMLRFGFVGIVSNGVYFSVLPLLTFVFDAVLWLAGAIAYASSVLVNYLLQRSLTFRSQRAHRQAGPRYLVVQAVALGLNSLLLGLLVTRMGLHFVIGQGAALVVTTAWNYLCQKFWVFE